MRLILNRRTDYAFRALVALASDLNHCRPAAAIAEEMAIPPSFVGPIMADLSRAGLVSSRRGRRGGYLLSRQPADIVLTDVITALEPAEAPTHCSMVDRSCDPATQCALHPIWERASAAYLETFGSVTLAMLAATDAAHRVGGSR